MGSLKSQLARMNAKLAAFTTRVFKKRTLTTSSSSSTSTLIHTSPSPPSTPTPSSLPSSLTSSSPTQIPPSPISSSSSSSALSTYELEPEVIPAIYCDFLYWRAPLPVLDFDIFSPTAKTISSPETPVVVPAEYNDFMFWRESLPIIDFDDDLAAAAHDDRFEVSDVCEVVVGMKGDITVEVAARIAVEESKTDVFVGRREEAMEFGDMIEGLDVVVHFFDPRHYSREFLRRGFLHLLRVPGYDILAREALAMMDMKEEANVVVTVKNNRDELTKEELEDIHTPSAGIAVGKDNREEFVREEFDMPSLFTSTVVANNHMDELTNEKAEHTPTPSTDNLPAAGSKSKLTDEEYDGIPTPSTGTPPVVGNKSKVARKQASSGVKIPATKRFANFNSRLNKLAEAKKADGKRFNKLVKKLQSHKTYAEKIVSSVVMALAALSTSFSQMSKQMQDVKESVSDLKFFKKVVEEEDYEMRVKKAEFSFCRLEAYMSAATGVLYDLSQGRFDLNELAGYVNYGVEEGEPEVVQPEDGNRVRSQPTMEDISGGDDDDGHLEFINVDGDVDEVVETVDVVEEVLPATPPPQSAQGNEEVIDTQPSPAATNIPGGYDYFGLNNSHHPTEPFQPLFAENAVEETIYTEPAQIDLDVPVVINFFCQPDQSFPAGTRCFSFGNGIEVNDDEPERPSSRPRQQRRRDPRRPR